VLKKVFKQKKPKKKWLKKQFKKFLKKNSITSKHIKIIKNVFINKNIFYYITIKVTPNNVFCTLKTKKNQTLIVLSAGILKIKTSKKKIKFSIKLIIPKFLKNLKKVVNNKTSIINISGPKKIRKNILKQIFKNLTKTKLIFNIKEKKCFNGCRAKKKKRKKRKGLRIFK
jgi:ribosomal protein S11